MKKIDRKIGLEGTDDKGKFANFTFQEWKKREILNIIYLNIELCICEY